MSISNECISTLVSLFRQQKLYSKKAGTGITEKQNEE